MCHSILFGYLLKILVNVVRFYSISFKFVIKINAPCQVPCFTCGSEQRWEGWSNYVECLLPSALLYERGPTSTFRSSNVQLFL